MDFNEFFDRRAMSGVSMMVVVAGSGLGGEGDPTHASLLVLGRDKALDERPRTRIVREVSGYGGAVQDGDRCCMIWEYNTVRDGLWERGNDFDGTFVKTEHKGDLHIERTIRLQKLLGVRRHRAMVIYYQKVHHAVLSRRNSSFTRARMLDEGTRQTMIMATGGRKMW
jgi:hypothetical protein